MGCCCGVSRFQALAQLFARGTHPIVAAIAASNTLAAPRVHFVLDCHVDLVLLVLGYRVDLVLLVLDYRVDLVLLTLD